MSILKRIKWTKIVLTLLLVSLATCSLMSSAKSLGSLLTSNAIEITNGTQWQSANSIRWSQSDSKTISAYWIINGYQQNAITYLQNFGVNVSISGGYDLEYYIRYELRNGLFIETDWYNVKDPINVAYRWDDSNTDNLRVYYYVRRVDGADLSSSDPSVSRIFANGIIVANQEVEQTTAIPSDWLDTTTQTYETATTVTRPAAYDDSVGTIPVLTPSDDGTPPSWFEQYNPTNKPWFVDILRSLMDWFDIVTLVEGQMKIFWVFGGFVVIGLLLAWLLH